MHDTIRTKLLRDGYVILDDFLSDAEVKELKTAGEELTEDLPEESSRTVFSTTKPNQNKDKYFLESSDKVSYFFENGAVDESGKLLVDPKVSLNKVGHALHLLHPTFEKYTFSNKVKETCWQLGFSEPVIVQSMYIYKNPGVGSEGTCVLIHGQVVHKSEHNKSQHPRHAYTFHIFDQKRAKYSPENWLQLKEGFNFPALYKSAPVSDV